MAFEKSLGWGAVLALMLAAPLASAQGARSGQTPAADFSLSAALGWSDNIRGEYVDQESETIAGLGLQAHLGRQNRRLNFNLGANLEYLDYLGDAYESELTGFAALDANAVLIPEMLLLVFQDNFGQTQSTPFAPNTPDTRQNVNVMALGPDLRLQASDSLVILGSGRYILEQYEDTPTDSTRTQAQLGLMHELSAGSSIAVLGQTTRVEYEEDSTGSDFDRTEALLRYQLSARRTDMMVEGGHSEFSADDGTEREMWLYRIEVSRELTPRTRLGFATGRELSDSGSLFLGAAPSMEAGGSGGTRSASLADLGLGATQTTGTGVVASTDSLINRYLRAAWRFTSARTRAFIGAEQREERYIQGVSQDRDLLSISAGFDRNITSAVRVGLTASHNTRESTESAIVLRDLSFRLTAFWHVSRRIGVSLEAERSQRVDSSTGGGFDDNRAWARLTWSPRGSPAN